MYDQRHVPVQVREEREERDVIKERHAFVAARTDVHGKVRHERIVIALRTHH